MPNVEHPHTYHSDKMKRCIEDLEAKGKEPGSAHAICYSSLGPEANKISKTEIKGETECPICTDIHLEIAKRKARIVTKNAKQRYTLGVVYEPDTLDTDNEFAKAEDIEAAAWDFMREIQGRGELAKAGLELLKQVKNGDGELKIEIDDEAIADIEKRGVNAMHLEDLADSEVVESFIAPTDMEIGGQQIKKGSWLAGIVWGPEPFKKIESGEWTGYSMGGTAKKVAGD